jgi:hypothetical protein
MNEENEDNCGAGDDDHTVRVNIEFFIEADEDAVHVKGASIHSHIHGVPPVVAAQTLLIVAQRAVVGWLAHTAFDEIPSSEVAHAMAEASAAVYMKKMIDDLPDAVEALEITIPDNISELLGD